MHSYDASGDAGVMRATIIDNVWVFEGETERFTGGFSENGSVFSGMWEQLSNGKQWKPWMDIRLERNKES